MKTCNHTQRILAILMLCAPAFCHAQVADNGGLTSVLKQYEAVIQSLPHHPLSENALEAAAEFFQSPESKGNESALRGIIQALPDSPLGIYALEKLLVIADNADLVCGELVHSNPDNAVGAYALNYLLEKSEDPILLGQEISLAYPNTRISSFVSIKLGDFYFAEGNFAQAEKFYFDAGLRALPSLLELWKANDRWLQAMLFPNAPGWPLPPVEGELFEFARNVSRTLCEAGHPEQDQYNEAFWTFNLNGKSLEYFMRDKGAYPWQWQAYATLLLTKKHIKEGRVLVSALVLEYLYGLLPDTTQANVEYILPCIGAYVFSPPEKFEADPTGQFSVSLETALEVARLEAIQDELLRLAMRSLPLAPTGVQAFFLHLIAMRQAATIDPMLAAKTLEQVALIPGVDAAVIATSNLQIEKLKNGEWKNAVSDAQ